MAEGAPSHYSTGSSPFIPVTTLSSTDTLRVQPVTRELWEPTPLLHWSSGESERSLGARESSVLALGYMENRTLRMYGEPSHPLHREMTGDPDEFVSRLYLRSLAVDSESCQDLPIEISARWEDSSLRSAGVTSVG